MEEVLRFGIDSRPAEAGGQRFVRTLASIREAANSTTTTVDRTEVSVRRLGSGAATTGLRTTSRSLEDIRRSAVGMHSPAMRARAALEGIEGPADRANRALGGVGRGMGSFGRSSGSLIPILGGVTAGLLGVVMALRGAKSYLDECYAASDRLDASQRSLAATARISGQNLGFLQTVSASAKDQFGLSAGLANDLTVELTKLASKAGQVEQTEQAIGRLLDLGAARGLSPEQSLLRIRQTILELDEGTDVLFNKNPSVLYRELAKELGGSAAKLTETGRATATFTSLMRDGGKVAGEYAKYLESPAGQQALLKIRTEEAQAAIGRSMNGIRTAVLPVLEELTKKLVEFVTSVRIFGAAFPMYGAQVGMWAAQVDESVGGALEGIANKITGFYDWAQKLPKPLQYLLGFTAGDATVGNAARFVAKAGAGGVEAARANLDAARQAFEAEAKRIRDEMSLATTITGPTDPIRTPPGPLFDPSKDAGMKAAESALQRLKDKVHEFQGLASLGVMEATALPDGIRDAWDRADTVRKSIQGVTDDLAALREKGLKPPAGVDGLMTSLTAEAEYLSSALAILESRARDGRDLVVRTDLQTLTSNNNSLVRGGAMGPMGLDAPRSFMERPEMAGLQRATMDYRNAQQSLRLALDAQDRVGAEQARTEIKRLERTIEEAKKVLAVALRSSGMNDVQIASVIAETDGALEKAGLKASKTNSTFEKFGKHASTMVGLSRGITSVADAMGGLSDDTRRAMQGVTDLAEGIERIAKGDIVGGVAQGIGGVIGMVKGIFGESAATKAQRDAIDANTRALELTRAALQGWRPTQTSIEETRRATTAALGDKELLMRLWVGGPEKDAAALNAYFKTFGLTLSQVEKLAEEYGIKLRDSTGNIRPEYLQQFSEYLKEAIGSLQGFRNTLDDQRQRDSIRSNLYGIEDTPQARLGNELGYLQKFAGTLSQQFGLNGLDLSSASGREAARKGLQALFERFDANQLPGLEGFTRDEFLAWLSSSASALAELDKATSAATSAMSSVPKALNLDLYRAIYGTRPVQAGGVTPTGPTPGYPTTPGTGTATVPPPPPGLSTPNPPRSGGGDTYHFDVRIDAKNRSGPELYDDMEAEAKRRVASGRGTSFVLNK